MKMSATLFFPLSLLLLLLLQLFIAAAATTTAIAPPPPLQLRYYSNTCPNAEYIVKNVMKNAIAREPRSVASVMRLQFHDCFVDGCDGSVLLDDTPTMLGEKNSLPNIGSLRSFEVIDEIKEALEKACPGVVSCADIIIMASRDAIVLTGGPGWQVKLGRKDSFTATQKHADDIIPSPNGSNATSLIETFKNANLSVKDLVALSGSHTIGKARCFSIINRLYNKSREGPDPTMDPVYRVKMEKLCPLHGDESMTVGMDATDLVFDNQYFKDLIDGKGFLHSDEILFGYPSTREYVVKYSTNQSVFFEDFVEGMIKMGELQSGQPGEIRKNCRVVNNP